MPRAARRVRPSSRLTGLTVLAFVAMLLASAVPTLAQDDEEPGTLVLPGSGREVPIYVVEGDIFILQDADWCENLIALTEADDAAADPARTERCARFMERLARNDVALLPRSLAAQLVALPDELLEPRPTAQPSRAPGTDAIRVTGRGESASRPFLLSGGDHRATVETDPGCEFFAAFLTDAATAISVADIEGDGRLADLPAGEHYWDVLAPDCDWSIWLRPD